MKHAVLRGPRGGRWVVEVPTSRRERARGLLGLGGLGDGRGLLIERARSVHTIGMRFPITAAFLDRELRVVEVLRLPPGRIALPRLRARHVLECGPSDDLRPGDRLELDGDTQECRSKKQQ